MSTENLERMKRVLVHILLLFGVLVSIFPFYWLIVMATNSTEDVFAYPPKLAFGGELWNNVQRVFEAIPFWSSLWNTVVVAVATTVLMMFFSSLAAFAFAKFEFPGKKPLFVMLLATLMVPSQLAVVPQFIIMANLGWAGTLQALIVPGLVSAFGIFLIRQYAENAVPRDLLDSARIDGCGFMRQYWNVAVPLLRPVLAFLGIFTFITAWNDYLWPLVIMINPDQVTLQVALAQLEGIQGFDYSLVMTGTLLAVIPLIVVFLFGARQFLADLAAGALKQ